LGFIFLEILVLRSFANLFDISVIQIDCMNVNNALVIYMIAKNNAIFFICSIFINGFTIISDKTK